MPHSIHFILLTISFIFISNAAIVGMDVGTQFIKTAYVGPKKIDIVENEESKRKDPSLLGLDKKSRRWFGSKAQKLSLTQPKRTILYPSRLLGKAYNNPYVEYLQSFLPCDIIPQNSSRPYSPPMYQIDNITLTSEEVTAMLIQRQLRHVKRQYQGAITDGVLTLSPFSTPIERYALMHSSLLAGLNPIGLVHSPMAGAVSLGINRDLFTEPTIVMFLDIGATSLDMGIFNFSSTTNTSGFIKTIGYYTSPYYGGHNFDVVIAEIIKKKLQQSNGIEITDSLYRQILLQAERAKIVLSVNKDAPVSIALSGGVEWNTKVSLSEFEEASESLVNELVEILQKGIEQIGIDKENINMVQLLGGGIRVPMVLKVIGDYFGDDVLKRNVDAEEGAAFGGAYYALTQGLGRMKKNYKIKDSVPIDYYIESPYLSKDFKLFSHKWTLDSYRTVSFEKVKNIKDFNFTISYAMMGDPNRVAFMVGLGDDMSFNQTLNPNGVDISLTFKLNSFGLIDMWKSDVKLALWKNCTERKLKVVDINVPVENITSNNTNETIDDVNNTNVEDEGKDDDKEDHDENKDEENDDNQDTINEDIVQESKEFNEDSDEEQEKTEEEQEENGENEETKTEKKQKKQRTEWENVKYECVKNETIKLQTTTLYHPLISYMTKKAKESKEILKWFDDNDDAFKKLGEAINGFETSIYRLREELNDKSDDFPNKFDYLNVLSEQQEYLEFNDIDDIIIDDFNKRIDVLKNIMVTLHPELNDTNENNKTEEVSNEDVQEEEEVKEKEEDNNENEVNAEEKNNNNEEFEEEEEKVEL
ncbi:Luminal-binding protein [Entamoeba marina]